MSFGFRLVNLIRILLSNKVKNHSKSSIIFRKLGLKQKKLKLSSFLLSTIDKKSD